MTKFEKVSFDTFINCGNKVEWIAPDVIEDATFWYDTYHDLMLPTRATKGSAGYDIHTPFAFTIKPGCSITIPTGIRCILPQDKVLMIFPRSGTAFKFRIGLVNDVAVIDSDFCNSDDGGHIMLKLCNDGDQAVLFRKNDRIAQGIIMPYFLTDDDSADGVRNGGFGSTDTQ